MTRKDPIAEAAATSSSVALGGNAERTRSHNRRVVLETVRQHGRLGRSDIAALTRLTAQAVSNIVVELVAEGLLAERGRRRTARGQPPVDFEVNADGGMTAGMEIGADRITTVLVDIAGGLRAQRTTTLPDASPPAVQALAALELAAARRAPGLPKRLLGCGVVMPGPFGVEGMSSIGDTVLPGWANLDAAALMTEALGCAVTVENDATAAAVGERLYGRGRDRRNFCLVYFGAGLGLGIIIDGQPYRGAYGNAGEIGHVRVVPGGRACPCGGHGCLERYASANALAEMLHDSGREAAYEDVARLADTRDPVVDRWIAEAATLLGPVVALLENLFDPETIVLGGTLPDVVMDGLVAAMQPLPLSVSSRSDRSVTRLQRGATGRLTAALGAAALPLLDTIAPKIDRVAPPEPIARAAGR
ncbi:sugar kinase [Alsobacter metallidurans]|uniref:Sugar kinase n=1 Tax=Alsobacter metallidurans TaxID=340221 RepID=A0A917I7C7_9HYPH|nr:ROK family protein [Alsobacter metallidurans]GGH22152.1 sugar kinase [Alsobacter metallidurans]